MATILVVDNEPHILELLEAFLSASGHMILTAGGGEEALQICHTKHEEIDVLVTDINMPGMDGGQLASHVKMSWPHIQVVFISGAINQEEFIAKGSWSEDIVFIAKPFKLSTVEDTVQQVLEA